VTDQIEEYPHAKAIDRIRMAADAGIAAIPMVGGTAQILIDGVITPSLIRRRDKWFEKLGNVLEDLQVRLEGFDVRDLAGNEEFVSGVMQASRIAMMTHEEEKLEFLRNCLANLAVASPGDLLAARFLRFVDELSPEHFLVLTYASDPRGWYQRKGLRHDQISIGAAMQVLRGANLPVTGPQLSLVLGDLDRAGLAVTASLNTMATGQGMWQAFATDLGTQLVAFIQRPRDSPGSS
jgi:hypothetical protein